MKRPKLVPNAGRVLRRSWTCRVLIAGGLLTAMEAVLPYLSGGELIPPAVFPLVAFAVVFAAFVARFVLQEGLRHGDD